LQKKRKEGSSKSKIMENRKKEEEGGKLRGMGIEN
jgi:hypothetical protein